LEHLQDQIQGVAILSETEETQLAADLERFGQQTAAVAEQQKQNAAGLAWHETLKRLEHELAGLADEKDKLDRENQAADPLRESLAAALRAQPLDSDYSSLAILRREQLKDQNTLAELERRFPQLEQTAASLAAAHAQAEQDLQTAQAAHAAIQPVLQSTRQYDWNINTCSTAATKLQAQVKQLALQLKQVGQDLELEQASLALALENLTTLNQGTGPNSRRRAAGDPDCRDYGPIRTDPGHSGGDLPPRARISSQSNKHRPAGDRLQQG